MAEGESPSRFRSSRGRADLNPYVDRIREYAPWALTTDQAEALRGGWRQEIGAAEDAPLLLEIGPGNGFFFRELCLRLPQAALLAVEVRFKRVWLTARKALQAKADNFRVVHHHAGHLDLLFAPGELDGVFINHPDPWPKDRHHKHRLLQESLRRDLERHLKAGGEVWLKSDFSPYGPLATELFDAPGWTLLGFAPDIHVPEGAHLLAGPPEGSRWWTADIETNYERKSRLKGHPILVAGFRWSGQEAS